MNNFYLKTKSTVMKFKILLFLFVMMTLGALSTYAQSITSISPASAASGASFTITGTGFADGFGASLVTNVTIAGISVGSYTVSSDGTTINTTIPANASSGNIVVTLVGGSTYSFAGFTFSPSNVPVPIVSVNSIIPSAGVTPGACITGNSFAFAVTNESSSITFTWNFGDGTTSTSATPTHSYTASGIYDVHVTATDGTSTSFFDQYIIVSDIPSVSYNILPATVNGTSYTFISTSTITAGYIATYAWTFGDGTTSTLSNPSHIYSTAGSKTVGLTITTDQGCSSTYSASQNIAITGTTASAAFSIDNSGQCLTTGSTADNFNFTNNLTGSGVTYSWNFGDGSTNNSGSNPVAHSYTNAGSYTVILTATVGGASTTYSQNVIVYPNPVASYTVTAGTNNGNSYTFNSTATISSGYIATYEWSFGDGVGTSVLSNPSYTYSGVGTNNVTLLTISDFGCYNSISASQNITLTSVTPVAAFTINTPNQCLITGSTANSFAFTNALTQGSGISYSWDFGDGTTDNNSSHYIHTTHHYSIAGKFTVVLTANVNGATSTYSQVVNVYTTPVPSYSVTSGTLNGNSYTFNNTSTIDAGYIASYAWDFGDISGSSAISNPTYTYGAVGAYNVSLIVTSDNGCSSFTTATQNITLTSTAGSAAFTVNNAGQCFVTGSTPNSFSFTNALAQGSGITYSWDFGDGTTDNNSAHYVHTSHSYTSIGTYMVVLTATVGSSSSTYSQSVTVYPNPVASYNVYAGTVTGNAYTFISSSSISSGNISSYAWDLGDGTGTATVSNPSYVYAAIGTYNVSLLVTSDNGCYSSITAAQIITLSSTPSNAGFSVNHSGQCLTTGSTANSFVFTNVLAQGSGITYSWDFGDGTTDNNSAHFVTVSHTYAAAGTYNAILTATIGGVSTPYSLSVIVYPMPVPSYYLLLNTVSTGLNPDLHICFAPGLDFSYITSSTLASGNMTYNWDYGTTNYFDRNGHATTSTNPRIVYNAAGTYPLILTVTSDKGCSASVTHTIYLSEPHAIFTSLVDNGGDMTVNPAITLTGTSSYDLGGTLVDYAWTYENGTHSHGAAETVLGPVHFAKGGVYTNSLLVTSDAGCTNSVNHTITFYIQPIGAFTLNSLSYGANGQPTASVATNTSTVDETPQVLTYSFDFGDVSSVSGATPSHTYTVGAASRTVTVTVTNTNGGLTNTYTQTITPAYIKPVAAIHNITRDNSDRTVLRMNFNANTSVLHDGAVGAVMTYDWDFGDGTIVHGTGVTCSHTYASGGNYTVLLTVTNTFGAMTSTASSSFTQYVTPVAGYTYSRTSGTTVAPIGVDFDASSLSSLNDLSGSLTYDWNYGDGSVHGTGAIPSHNYTNGGSYIVTLTVTNTNGGLQATSTHTVAYYVAPVAGYSFSRSTVATVAPIGVDFDASTLSTVSDNAVLSYDWDFGDLTTHGTGATPSHHYTNGGSYTVTLTVTSNNGNTQATSIHTVAYYVKPVAGFSFSRTSAATATPDVNFDATTLSTISDNGSLSYDWDYGDGTVIHGSGVTTSHSYTSGGSYSVILTVTSNNGNLQATSTQTVAYYVTPISAFTASLSHDVNGYPVASVTNNSSVNETTTLTYSWTYGDGIGTSTSASPSDYTYSTGAASRSINLRVTNTNGGVYADATAVTLNNAYIIPVNVTPTITPTDLSIAYSSSTAVDNSGGTIDYSWDFGDGTTTPPVASGTSATQNGIYTYASGGTYTVTLTVTSSNGGVTVVTTSVTVVAPTPVAKISINTVDDGDGTYTYSIYGDNLTNPSTISSGSITGYSWDYILKDDLGTVITSGTETGADQIAPNVPNNWTLSLTLTVTSDQGITGSTSAFLDPANSIFSGYTSVRNTTIPNHYLFTISHNNVLVYPNPVVNNATIRYNSDVAGTMNISIYSADGKLVHLEKGNSVGYGVSNTVKLNISNFTKGIYNVIVTDKTGKKIGSTRLVKVN